MIKRINVGHRLSDVAVFQNIAWFGGQVPRPEAGSEIRGQMSDVLAQIDELLAGVGSDKSKILSCQIFLADINDAAAMNEVWDAWVAPGNAPPRATVQAAMVRPEYRVEVVLTAAITG